MTGTGIHAEAALFGQGVVHVNEATRFRQG